MRTEKKPIAFIALQLTGIGPWLSVGKKPDCGQVGFPERKKLVRKGMAPRYAPRTGFREGD